MQNWHWARPNERFIEPLAIYEDGTRVYDRRAVQAWMDTHPGVADDTCMQVGGR